MNFQVTTRRRMPATATRTATFLSWAARTTLSTWQATVSPPARMEEVLASHKDVAECAVVGAFDILKGEVPVGFLVVKSGVVRDLAQIEREVVELVRERIGPVAAFKTRGRGFPPAEDPLRQDPAQHDQEDRRRPELYYARDA